MCNTELTCAADQDLHLRYFARRPHLKKGSLDVRFNDMLHTNISGLHQFKIELPNIPSFLGAAGMYSTLAKAFKVDDNYTSSSDVP